MDMFAILSQYTMCSHASGLWHPLVSMFTKSEEKWSLPGVVCCFWRVLENCDCRTKFNSSVGNTTANYMDFLP